MSTIQQFKPPKNIYIRRTFGKVHYVQITRTNLGPVRTDVNSLWDLAPHDLSILHYWFGEYPVSVNAVGHDYLGTGQEDVVFATYRYRNDLLAQIHVSWLNPKKVREIVVVGEQKMLIWDDMNVQYPITIFDKNITMEREGGRFTNSYLEFRSSVHDGDTLLPKVRMLEPLAEECKHFIDAIHNPGELIECW